MKWLLVILTSLFVMSFVSADLPKVNLQETEAESSIPKVILEEETTTSNISTFLDLTDTPNSYVGEGGNCVLVTGSEDGLEFGTCGTGSGGNPFDQWLNTTDSPTFDGLTLTGQLIMQALISSQDIIPVTDSLYSLGNSTHRFQNVYADNVDATTISSNSLSSNTVDATNVSSDLVNISSYEIIESGGNLVIKLT